MRKVDRYINVVDYQYDIGLAVEKLQNDTLQSGDYRFESVQCIANEPEKENTERNSDLEKPMTIDDVRNQAGELGTCSALDIYGIRDELHFACLSPLNDAESLAYFGTDKLTVEDIERINNNKDFWGSMGRGEARYVVLFDGKGNKAQPVKYYIGGLAFG